MSKPTFYESRKWIYFVLPLALAIAFVVRLLYIQVLDDSYKFSAQNNFLRKITLYPDRGYVFDRNGKLIISNQPAYDIMVLPREIKDLDTLALCESLGISTLQFEEYYAKMRGRKGYSYYKPSLFMQQVSKEQIAAFQERMFAFQGFYMQRRTLRSYPYGVAGQSMGYIREISEPELSKFPGYVSGDYIGASGIEKSYEEVLRGKSGVQYVMVDVFNRQQGPFEGGQYDTLPIPGSTVKTTIDIELQAYAEALMKNKRGSVVAIDPSTGEILLLVSSPGYDPNLLIGRQRNANYRELDSDTFNIPLYDRSLLAEYPPGSPFKILIGLIGLQEGVITTQTPIFCRDGFRSGKLHVHCHAAAGSYALERAVVKSCNGYFCTVYKQIVENYPTPYEGLNAWSNHVKSFGLGQFLNNDLWTGRKGFVPNGDYFNKIYGAKRWRAVTTISLGIGQGELVVTPIQLANMTAAVANRGYYYTPHIVKEIDGKPINDTNYTIPKYTTVDPKNFETVIDGMLGVFESPEGTAYWSRVPGIQICGKTGTAENPHGQDHSIFIAFAPKDNPKIAMAVIVENGYWGSRWAGPIASLIIEKYLTGEIKRPEIEKRMLEGSLEAEYRSDRVYNKKK